MTDMPIPATPGPPPPPPPPPGHGESAIARLGTRAPGGAATKPPNHAAVFVAVYRLLLRSVATTGRVIAILALTCIGVVTAIGVHSSHPYDSYHAGVSFSSAMFFWVLPIAVLVFGSATIGDLIDDGSLVYIWLRPVSSWLHVAAAWLATVTVTVPIVLVPITLSAAIIDSDSTLLGAIAAGGFVAILSYSALFVAMGIRFKRALPWGLAYILIWEGFIASAGKSASKLAVRSYVGSVIARISGQYIKLANLTLASAIVVPLVAGLLLLVLATRRLARTDVP